MYNSILGPESGILITFYRILPHCNWLTASFRSLHKGWGQIIGSMLHGKQNAQQRTSSVIFGKIHSQSAALVKHYS